MKRLIVGSIVSGGDKLCKTQFWVRVVAHAAGAQA